MQLAEEFDVGGGPEWVGARSNSPACASWSRVCRCSSSGASSRSWGDGSCGPSTGLASLDCWGTATLMGCGSTTLVTWALPRERAGRPAAQCPWTESPPDAVWFQGGRRSKAGEPLTRRGRTRRGSSWARSDDGWRKRSSDAGDRTHLASVRRSVVLMALGRHLLHVDLVQHEADNVAAAGR